MGLYRDKQTASVLKEQLSLIIQREVKDPRIKTELITITDIKVSKDLRMAFVHISIFTQDEKERHIIFKGLKRASSFIRSKLGSMIRSKYTPEIRFKEDSSLREGALLYQRIHNITSTTNLDNDYDKE